MSKGRRRTFEVKVDPQWLATLSAVRHRRDEIRRQLADLQIQSEKLDVAERVVLSLSAPPRSRSLSEGERP